MNYIKRIYSGRIGRKNHGLGFLLYILTLIPVMGMLASLSLPLWHNSSSAIIIITIIAIIALYAVFIVHIFSLHARRFHDLGKPGWLALFLVIPAVGAIIFVYLLFTKGQEDSNKYGKAPSKDTKFFDAIFNRNQNADRTPEENKDKKENNR